MVKRRRKGTLITMESPQRLKDRFYSYLDRIYLNSKEAASFSSANKLFREVQKRSYYTVRDISVINEYLSGIPSYGLFKYRKKSFYSPRVVTKGVNQQGAADLMSVQRTSEFNDDVKYILIVIDDFSRFLRVEPLTDKTGPTVARAMDKILSKMSKPFTKICCDMGVEFRAHTFREVLSKYGAQLFFPGASVKCTIVERVIRTLRTKIARYLEYKGGERYIDRIQDIVDSYNKTYHRSIKMAPISVTELNEHEVFANLYKNKIKFDLKQYKKPFKYPVGSKVRISLSKGLFPREYKEKYSREIYTVARAYKLENHDLYDVKDCNDDVLTSAFYEHELTAYRPNDKFKDKIDYIADEEVRNGKSYVLVKFSDSQCKEWVLKKAIQEMTS